MRTGRFPYRLIEGTELLSLVAGLQSLHASGGLQDASAKSNDLMFRILEMNPQTRISTEKALAYDWFAQPITAMEQDEQLMPRD
jgi:serine/threonine protein kinase